MTKKNTAAADTTDSTRYTKKQLIGSEKYRSQKDLLGALLDDEKSYSKTETEETMNQFLKGKVKVC